jgi:hypothetical protein
VVVLLFVSILCIKCIDRLCQTASRSWSPNFLSVLNSQISLPPVRPDLSVQNILTRTLAAVLSPPRHAHVSTPYRRQPSVTRGVFHNARHTTLAIGASAVSDPLVRAPPMTAPFLLLMAAPFLFCFLPYSYSRRIVLPCVLAFVFAHRGTCTPSLVPPVCPLW